MRILLIGDSITDAGRDRRNYHHLGNGYPLYAAELIRDAYPDTEFEFINFGISGNRTAQLFDRLYSDCIAFEPDIVSVFVGINDIWHRYIGSKILTTDEQVALNYRCILERLKRETHAKILMLAPYILDDAGKAHMVPDLERLLPVIDSLAEEYADAYVPLDKLFAKALEVQPAPMHYSPDGVHPNENGARFIAGHYFNAIAPLVESLA